MFDCVYVYVCVESASVYGELMYAEISPVYVRDPAFGGGDMPPP